MLEPSDKNLVAKLHLRKKHALECIDKQNSRSHFCGSRRRTPHGGYKRDASLLLYTDAGDIDRVEALPPCHRPANVSSSLTLRTSPDKGRWMEVRP